MGEHSVDLSVQLLAAQAAEAVRRAHHQLAQGEQRVIIPVHRLPEWARSEYVERVRELAGDEGRLLRIEDESGVRPLLTPVRDG